MPKQPKNLPAQTAPDYDTVLAEVAALLETARRADYGTQLLLRLATDLTARFGRGFSRENLQQMRQFYMTWPIRQTVSAQLENHFPLPWSHSIKLLSVRTEEARRFYETEALRGGWSLRQLNQQRNTQFYERTALSKNKAVMLTTGAVPQPEDTMTAESEIKDPSCWNF